jgi:class 3 adenylate cyclase
MTDINLRCLLGIGSYHEPAPENIAVNTASRMESHGIPGYIQVSSSTYDHLKEKYLFEERGIIYVKGKGEMVTYLLKSRKFN